MTGVTAHSQARRLSEVVFYPEHDPRKASQEYHQVHHHLINVLDEPCWICGVRKSTIADPTVNLHGAREMETHHWQLKWSLANAADPAKILAAFPAMRVADEQHLREWLDSEGNMLVLCDHCHRSPHYGIHSITYPAWVAQRWLRVGWDLATGPTAA